MTESPTALVVAVGGATPVGEAGLERGRAQERIGTPQLKRNAVKAAKIAPNAVRTGHVLDGSLLTVDFKAGQIPQGMKGDTGAQGSPGLSGVQIVTATSINNSDVLGEATATCPSGKKVIGGGAQSISSPAYSSTGFPVGDNAWRAVAYPLTPGAFFSVRAYAICATPQ